MDERGATSVTDLVAMSLAGATQAPEVNSALPMFLIMISGGMPGAMLRLSTEGTSVGRGAENSLSLPEATVSRHHAHFSVDFQGHVRLTDLASTNGTLHNGRKLVPHVSTRLEDGDRIQLGSLVVLKFVRLDPRDEQFQRDLYERITRDELTGLYNRSYFLNQMAAMAGRGALRGLGLAILMLDIDHFKRVNDTYGHDAGDTVIRRVAGVLRESTRPDDLVARYGGEEFIVALPVAAPDMATERAERIRRNLEECPIEVGKDTLHVTGSLGLAYAQAGSFRSAHALINIADHGLYQAKREGRNRVIFSHGATANDRDGHRTETD